MRPDTTAIADFNQVLRLAPELLIGYYNRGIACHDRGDLDQALASWIRAIQLGYTRVEVYCSRGILYAKQGEPQKAIADFDEAIRIDAQYAAAYNHRASARAALGQAQEAADDRAEAARLLENEQKSTRNEKAAGLNPTPEDDDKFGTSVAAVGNNVLIGAHRDNINATRDGAAYLFDGATGELLQSSLNPTQEYLDMLGWSVAAVVHWSLFSVVGTTTSVTATPIFW